TFWDLNICSACSDKCEKDMDKIAVTYYINSKNGNDLNDGLSEVNAWKSLVNLKQQYSC
ncbi:unnamed protein product, partial [marine sediment metagenome]